MRKTRVFGILVYIVAFCLFTIVSVAVAWDMASDTNSLDYDYVVIQEGDTLWSIAKGYTDVNGDIRKTIYEIKRLNDLSSAMVRPGDIIAVPRST